ncbi:uncharacterized protein LOC127873013 isoform X1 [Dreissena polymorpha]|uniref:uncharacterized protein LOC127873013 isoform X1 n=1 Tax=Dreissena polymorpha TaxID=45954 RepID=UPI0022640678|nr:uncharacterized protein LOC127873013 isoform X1 [Dreissena polymorpha]
MYTLFNLVRLITVKDDVKPVTFECFAWRQHGETSLLSLACSNGFIILRYCNSGCTPVVKQLPWPQDHPIKSMCFDPTVTWLLVLTDNGNIFIIPAVPMLDPSIQVNQLWSIDDVTIVTVWKPRGTPTHMVWWQTLDGRHIAIIATKLGELCFIDLERRVKVTERCVDEHVSSTELIQDDQQTITSLLVTGKTGKQWKMLLEKKWARLSLQEADMAHELGYENLDGHTITFITILDKTVLVENQEDMFAPVLLTQFSRSVTLNPQYAKGRHLVTAYCTKNSTYEVFASDMEHSPLFVYKLPIGSLFTTFTDRLTFLASKLAGDQKLTIVSNQRAEVSDSSEHDFNKDSVVQQFEIPPDEKLVSILAKPFPFYWHEKLEEDHHKHLADTDDHKNAESLPSAYNIILNSHTVLDGCIVITNNTVYECRPRISPERLFLELCISQSDSSLVEQLGISLGLDLNFLFEIASDYLLSHGNCKQATRLFHLSKGSPISRIASFSKYGYVHEILPYLQQLLRKGNSELNLDDHRKLVELGLYGLVYRLTLEPDNEELINNFKQFLVDYAEHEDTQKLTIQLLTEAGLLNILMEFTMARGLVIEALQSLTEKFQYTLPDQTVDMLIGRGFGAHLAQVASGAFLHVLELHKVIQIFCERPQLVSRFSHLLLSNLCDLDTKQLLDLACALDPSQPIIRGFIQRKMRSRQRTSSVTSLTGSGEFGESVSNRNTVTGSRSMDAVKMVHTFLMVVLHLNQRRTENGEPVNTDLLYTDIPTLLKQLAQSACKEKQKVSIKPLLVGAGQTHAAAVTRHGDLYTWGRNSLGRLGHGEQKASSQTSGPCKVATFATLQIKVLSVACGLNHTLALTQQGVYSWGSSAYGQVGLGTTHVYTRPMLIEELCGVVCSAIDCGQYHSLALTDTAQVYSWGWGVHGQLGHGDTEERLVPRCITALSNQSIVQIAGGYCHTIVLNNQGEVYTFGCGFFGQLGLATTNKHTTPVKVTLIPDKVIAIATKYFHSVAVTAQNVVYQWGSHPHGLRHFVHSQRRSRQTGNVTFEQVDVHLRPMVVDTSYVHGRIKQVFCGSFHSGVRTKDGEVYTWGRNMDGQLGNGTRSELRLPQMVTTINDRNIRHLTSGGEFNVAMDTEGQLFVWGRNEFCQLGMHASDVRQTTKVIKFTGSKNVGQDLTEILVPAPLSLNPLSPSATVGSPWHQTDSGSLMSWTEEDAEDETSLHIPNLQEVGDSQYGRLVVPVILQCVPSLTNYSSLLRQAIDMKDWVLAASLNACTQEYPQAFGYHLMAIRMNQSAADPQEMLKSCLKATNYYYRLIEEAGIQGRSLEEDRREFLYQLFYHWEQMSDSVTDLEQFLSAHLDDLACLLATILFSTSESTDSQEKKELYQPSTAFLSKFSARFKLQISSVLLKQISLIENAQFASSSAYQSIQKLGGDAFETIPNAMLDGDKLPYDQLWLDILQNLQKGQDTRNYIYVTHNELDRLQDRVSSGDQGQITRAVFFTCGHYYTKDLFTNEIERFNLESFIGGFKLPETLSVIREYYSRKEAMPLACPRCVLSALNTAV